MATDLRASVSLILAALIAKGKTKIGNNNLIMAYVHIAHDCIVGNNVILVNNTQLAGEVIIEDYVMLAQGRQRFVRLSQGVFMLLAVAGLAALTVITGVI